MVNNLYNYTATLYKVIDGDTLDLMVDLGFSIYTVIRVRLARINTYELKSKNPTEKQTAINAMKYLDGILKDKKIYLNTIKDKKKNDKKEKYGRYLAEIYVKIGEEVININDVLVDVGYAKPFMDK